MTVSDVDAGGKSVTVLGGSGYVGSRVCRMLVEKGASVTSLSKSGTPPSSAAASDDDDSSWNDRVTWKAVDLVTASDDQLDSLMGQPDAVISCVGAVGNDPEALLRSNGLANVRAFESAKRAASGAGGVRAVAYVSVSSEVAACQDNWLPEFFGSYFEGKGMAEAAAKDVCDDVTVVRPTFIYGGDAFGLFPPRVNTAYGSFIDQLLSFGLFKLLADVAPGLIKVALRPPVAVESVAGACVDGVFNNNKSGVKILDTAAEINEASGQPEATGVQDAIDWTVKAAGEVAAWIQEKAKEMETANEKKYQ